MRILGHIHTLNDADVIDRSLGALLAQTRPLDAIVIVDNGSTDGTLDRDFPEHVTIIRHRENLGTNGAVVSGFRHALAKGFDWIWVFDADSAPRPDALEKLLSLYESLPEARRQRVWRLSSLPVERLPLVLRASARLAFTDLDKSDGMRERHGITFTPRGYRVESPPATSRVYECDATIWTGCLFKMSAVAEIGLPSPDWVLDWGEYEYGFRGRRAGLTALMHCGSVVDHNIGDERRSIGFTTYRVGPLTLRLLELPPIRCYYICRNILYFWLYEYPWRNVHTLAPRLLKIAALLVNFAVRPRTHAQQARACLRGIRDGWLGRLERRYS